MAQQTAVEWLSERLIRMIPTISPMYKYEIKEFVEQAKAMEKEQIINAHLEGWSDAYDYLRDTSNNEARQAEQYYNETYK
jgi:hypothetical protein